MTQKKQLRKRLKLKSISVCVNGKWIRCKSFAEVRKAQRQGSH